MATRTPSQLYCSLLCCRCCAVAAAVLLLLLLLPLLQLAEALRGRRSAEQKVMQLNQELIQTRNTANQVGCAARQVMFDPGLTNV